MANKKTYVLMVSERFPVHHIRKGELTCFIRLIEEEIKLHTIRDNYEFWKKRIEEINTGKAILSVRVWNGKPYGKGSTQFEFFRFNKVGFQRIEFVDEGFWIDGEKMVSFKEVAKNDGLTEEDMRSWFKNASDEPKALIHFGTFKY